MRLSALAALERQKIEDELKEKKKIILELETLLKSPAKILDVVKNEILELKKIYGDERKTKVIASGLKEFKEEDLIAQEEVIINLSPERLYQKSFAKHYPNPTPRRQRTYRLGSQRRRFNHSFYFRRHS